MHSRDLGYRIVKIDQVKCARVNRNATRRLHFGKHFAALGLIMRSRARRRFIIGFCGYVLAISPEHIEYVIEGRCCGLFLKTLKPLIEPVLGAKMIGNTLLLAADLAR
jgi:hypothetical protein